MKKIIQYLLGERAYSDEHGYWLYRVRTSGSRITLKLYPGKNNDYYPKKNTVHKRYSGTIESNGRIKIIDPNYEFEFKFMGKDLYEMNNEGGWNRYDYGNGMIWN